MVDVSSYKGLDEMDKRILNVLQQEAQLSNVELARIVNLSPPATHVRVKKLEQEGYIDRYAAILNKEKLGFNLLCFLFVNTAIHQVEQLHQFEETVCAMPQVLECINLTGEFDYMLKIALKDRQDLRQFVKRLNLISSVSKITTTVVMEEIKSTTALPILECGES